MNNLIQRTTELAMHIISSYVRPGDIVIDATCGNGHDTLRLARMGAGMVFAFDVQPEAVAATRALLHKEGFPVSAEAGQSIGAEAGQSASAEAEQLTGIDAPACRPRVVLACLGHERMAEFFRGRTQSECSGAIPADADPGTPLAGPGALFTNPGTLLADPEGFASAIVFNLGYLPGGDKGRTTQADTTLEAVRASLCLLKKDGLLCITMYSGHPEGAEEKRALLAFAEGLDPKLWHVCYLSMPNQKNHPPEILLISRKK